MRARAHQTFRRAESGIAAIEFAIVAPMLILLMVGMGEAGHFVQAYRHFGAADDTLARLVSQVSPPLGSRNGTIGAADIASYETLVPMLFPEALQQGELQQKDWTDEAKITVSYYSFKQSGTTYVAHLDWTAGSQPRTCGTYSSGAGVLPAALFGAGSVFVVDMSFTYQSMFWHWPTFAKTLTKSAYFAPRYATTVTFDSTQPAPANFQVVPACP